MDIELKLNNIFDFVDKIYNFKTPYLFKESERWGTEYDWRLLLNTTNPNSSAVQNFVKLLISTNILVKNNGVIKQSKRYDTYKLNKKYKDKLLNEIIEITPEFIWLEKYYDVDKGVF